MPASNFVVPPSDGSVPISHLLDFHLKYNPQHPWIVLSDGHSETIITYEQLAHAAHNAIKVINPNLSITEGAKVGILATTDSIVYLTLLFGISLSGLVPFPISPRTPLAGIIHLLKTTDTSHIILDGSPAMVELSHALATSDSPFTTLPLPTLTDLYPNLGSTSAQGSFWLDRPSSIDTASSERNTEQHSAAAYVDTSNFKHPANTQRAAALFGQYAEPGERLIRPGPIKKGDGKGYILDYIGPLTTGYVGVLFSPSSPPTVPTAELTLQVTSRSGCVSLPTVPAFLEAWARDQEAIELLKRLRAVMFGGGSLSDWAGDILSSRGVQTYSIYGSTEVGGVTYFNASARAPADWTYVQFSDRVDVRFVEQGDAEGSCEVFFVECDTHQPFVFNYEMDGKRAYRTHDLLVRHPTKPWLWKSVGRMDDQIVLLNGEKVTPGPMEEEIQKSPIVNAAVMFGRERNQTGVLVELVNAAQSRTLDAAERTQVIEEIWPFIENANATSPAHARLARSAVLFTHPERPLPRTPKGNVRRSAALDVYQDDIKTLYASIERGEGNNVAGPADWTETSVMKWLGDQAKGLLGREVDVEADLFQQGLDSLAATLLTRTIKSALHHTTDPTIEGGESKIDQQTVFQRPSIQQLARHIISLSSGSQSADPAELHKANLIAIKSLIDKHTPTRPASTPQVLRLTGERIVLTGTTGALGSHILVQLLQNDKVERVWALNRKPRNGDVMNRQRLSFEDKSLDVGLLESEKLVLLEAELTKSGLGLASSMLDEIRTTATAIIHNAWQVNFNLTLQSFEPSIVGAKNLIDLASDSVHRPRFIFTSSISVAGVGKIGGGLPEGYISLDQSTKRIGYGESKLVAEKMLESARSAGLETCIVRFGQLTGDKSSGSWSSTDWVPSVIASSLSVGCLPDALGIVSWIPLDIAATTAIDACLSRDDLLSPVINCAHPRPILWSQAMSGFSNALQSGRDLSLPLVPLSEWNTKVVTAAARAGSPEEAFRRYPSTKIQATIDGMIHLDKQVRDSGAAVSGGLLEAGGAVVMSTTKAMELSATLSEAEPLGEEHIRAWVAYWKKQGLFV
ncbi:L-aminoadipate-semialdehyde dehydrogenase [Ceratobasidium sp. AG-Ba]|nr:L-aminoadipate-semialdehyde dehydrogenase [Ceratobasidium sp. AG-Ba]